MKKFLLLTVIITSGIFAQAKDSVDIRAIVQKQIDAAREKEKRLQIKNDSLSSKKVFFGPEIAAVPEKIVYFGPEPEYFGPEEAKIEKPAVSDSLKKAAGEQKYAETLKKIVNAPVVAKQEKKEPAIEGLWKFYFLGGAAAIIFLFVFIRRIYLNRSKKSNKAIKNNIRIIREESLVKRENGDLKKVRSKLVNSPVILNNHGKPLSTVAKELNISQGEIILAAKIKSYELNKDEKNKWHLN